MHLKFISIILISYNVCLIFILFFSALESPSMRSSPSLYEGAFRLETTARPSDMFSSSLQATMLIGQLGGLNGGGKDHNDEDASPLSSPADDSSYKIRIGPRGSSSPTSHDDDENGVGGGKISGEMDTEAQDLTVVRGEEGMGVEEDLEKEYHLQRHQTGKLNFEDENCMQ